MRAVQTVVVAATVMTASSAFDEMNGKYAFANQLPGTAAIHRGSAYFEVESEPIESVYAQVNWKVHNVPIDAATVTKLKGKLINLVGYEFDIMRVLPNGTEVSAHPWEQYNHHYGNTVMGDGAKLVKTGHPTGLDSNSMHGDEEKLFPGYRLVPSSVHDNLRGKAPPTSSAAMIMGNGAESRKTFHFLPPGYGAMVKSPSTVVLHPMIIDTANREPSTDHGTDAEHTRHGIVPPSSNVGPSEMYSGLMECPCTDRYPKKMSSYSTLKFGSCNPAISSAADCFAAAAELGLLPLVNTSTIRNSALPVGCSVQPTVGGFDAVFNAATQGTQCGHHAASGPILPKSCNLSGTWAITNRNNPVHLRFREGIHSNTYIVDAGPRTPIRAYINVSAPNATDPQGIAIGSWIKAKSHTNQPTSTVIPATISGYPLRQKQNPPPCSELSWENGVVMVKMPYANMPKRPSPPPARVTALGEDLVNISVDIDPAKDEVTIRLSGPSDVWFGVGLGASTHAADPSDPSTGLSMLGTNWTIVVLGNGSIMERRLGNHEPGVLLPQSVNVVSNVVENSVRTVTLTRPIAGREFTFNPLANSLGFINAIGTSPDFLMHQNKSTALMYFVEADAPTCICDVAADQGTLGGFAWGNQRCLPRPLGVMLDDPGWRNITGGINPTCSLKYYRGGLRCCKDGSILLDKNQSVPQNTYTYRLKYRYYYDVLDENDSAPSVVETFRTNWWTEHLNNEHDVPLCTEANKSKCVYQIDSNFTAGDLSGCASGCKMIHMEGHCHIGCIKMEMWIMDDPANPRLLCRTQVKYGSGDNWMNEMGYIAGNLPCIFGGDGYATPVPLHPHTKLRSIKYQNNTHARYGDMALWELRAAQL